MENVEVNEGRACMNQSSSADMKFKCQNASSQSSMVDGSSVVLKSLLGVDDNYSAMNDAYQNQTPNLSNVKVRSNFKKDEMPSDLLKTPVGTGTLLAPKTRGILRSSSVGNSPLSLQDVIEKISGHREPKVKFAPTIFTRSRSLSMSDVPSSASTCNVSTKSQDNSINLEGSPIEFSRSKREGTPESDAGYVTSARSMSPEYNLNELVRAMTLGSPQDLSQVPSSSRTKLPSISEIDPAVSHAVKSPPYTEHAQFDSANLISSLFSYPGVPPFNENVSQFGNLGGPSLMSERNHVNSLFATHPSDPTSLERAAKLYRNAASLYDASCTWSGQLPPRQHQNPMYSNKVFIGGVPWDISERCLMQAFEQFGNVRIEWPGRGNAPSPPKGYLYIVFESEAAVNALLSHCTHDFTSSGGSWYYRISSRRMRCKEVQIIPWVLADSNFVRCPSQRLDPQKTVFVGALHGMLNAEGLAHIFNDLFGGVVYAGIDTDRHKYPIGSGRVTFNNHKSYMKAVAAAFIEIKSLRFTKKVQVDPYLEDALCSNCLLKQGPYFCR